MHASHTSMFQTARIPICLLVAVDPYDALFENQPRNIQTCHPLQRLPASKWILFLGTVRLISSQECWPPSFARTPHMLGHHIQRDIRSLYNRFYPTKLKPAVRRLHLTQSRPNSPLTQKHPKRKVSVERHIIANCINRKWIHKISQDDVQITFCSFFFHLACFKLHVLPRLAEHGAAGRQARLGDVHSGDLWVFMAPCDMFVTYHESEW